MCAKNLTVNIFQILFVPVVSQSRLVLPEVFVVQLELMGHGASRKIYTIDREEDGEMKQLCYCRCGRTNVEVSNNQTTTLLNFFIERELLPILSIFLWGM